MEILVIGGTGHVGLLVVDDLRARGVDVRVLARLSNLPLDSRLPFCNTRLVEQVAKRAGFNSPEPLPFFKQRELAC
jgi:uncharacterized protein YbjT (DUF2867 family)